MKYFMNRVFFVLVVFTLILGLVVPSAGQVMATATIASSPDRNTTAFDGLDMTVAADCLESCRQVVYVGGRHGCGGLAGC